MGDGVIEQIFICHFWRNDNIPVDGISNGTNFASHRSLARSNEGPAVRNYVLFYDVPGMLTRKESMHAA